MTWGVFPGQEIAQSTIIEKESFLSWKVTLLTPHCLACLKYGYTPQEEALSIWSDWASFYRPGSEERGLLESIRDQKWLVSIVHHDYKDFQALWKFLFDDEL